MPLGLRAPVVLLFALVLTAAARPAFADESEFTAAEIARARDEVTRQVDYDSRYASLAYPGGDIDPSRGVCTDVVVRALRVAGIDLQEAVHRDEVAHREAYALGPGHGPDANIDHRRVRPLLTWFRRHAEEATTTVAPETYADFHPGDVVVFTFTPCPACRSKTASANHIGIVSDRKNALGRPLVIHNFGPKATEDDGLTFWPLLAHFHVSADMAKEK